MRLRDILREPGTNQMSLGRVMVAWAMLLVTAMGVFMAWRGADLTWLGSSLVATILGGYLVNKWSKEREQPPPQ